MCVYVRDIKLHLKIVLRIISLLASSWTILILRYITAWYTRARKIKKILARVNIDSVINSWSLSSGEIVASSGIIDKTWDESNCSGNKIAMIACGNSQRDDDDDDDVAQSMDAGGTKKWGL